MLQRHFSSLTSGTISLSLNTLAQQHYENFPVGSRFIPKRYRKPIHLLYAFARVADDLADEGTLTETERIDRLDEWEYLLDESLKGNAADQFFEDLAEALKNHHLSPELLKDLLKAFRRDSGNPIYQSFDDVLDYCKYSANSIGRLLLELFGCSNEQTIQHSDKICTALQLTNFWQDISVDTSRNRIYIPLTNLQYFGVTVEDFRTGQNSAAFTTMMKANIERTKSLFLEGKTLINIVPRDFRFELALIWHGGMRVLEKIEQNHYDTRSIRPVLNTTDKARVFFKALTS